MAGLFDTLAGNINNMGDYRRMMLAINSWFVDNSDTKDQFVLAGDFALMYYDVIDESKGVNFDLIDPERHENRMVRDLEKAIISADFKISELNLVYRDEDNDKIIDTMIDNSKVLSVMLDKPKRKLFGFKRELTIIVPDLDALLINEIYQDVFNNSYRENLGAMLHKMGIKDMKGLVHRLSKYDDILNDIGPESLENCFKEYVYR